MSTTGKLTVLNASPATSTSDFRKKTMTSPSVCAFGTWMNCTASPLKCISNSSVKNVSVGSAYVRQRRLHLDQARLDVLVRQDLGEVRRCLTGLTREVARNDRLARLGHLGVAPGVIGIHVRVDDPANGLIAGKLFDLGNQLVRKPSGHRVHDEHPLVADLDRGVDTAAVEHPDVALHVEGMHFVVGAGIRDSGSGIRCRACPVRGAAEPEPRAPSPWSRVPIPR